MFKFLRHKTRIKTYLFFILFVGIVLWYFFIRVPNYKLEQLRIYFPEESYNKLSGYADNALDKGYLKREEDDYVPGNIVYRNEMIEGKFRLKGDWLDHVRNNKWSFRIKLKEEMKDELKVFSVQNPKTRGFLNGYVYYQMLKDEGVLTNEFRYVHLYVNDRSWGVYCLEEHLSSRMMSNQNKPEGVILKFDDMEYFNVAKDADANTDGLIKKAEIKLYGDLKKKKKYKGKVQKARDIVHAYQHQTDSVLLNFESKVTGDYYALSDLNIAYHGMGWINVRFYYNFLTEKMEPVGYDPYPVLDEFKPAIGSKVATTYLDSFETKMIMYRPLKNKDIESEYNKALHRVSDPEFVQIFMEKHKEYIEFLEKEIQKEYYMYEYDYNFIYNRAKEIREYLKSNK